MTVVVGPLKAINCELALKYLMLQVKIDLQNMFTLQANMSKNVPIIDLV